MFLDTFFASILSSDSGSSFSPGPPTPTGKHAEPWEKNGGFVIYLVVMFYVFYGFEIICDEFLVPALNLFCEKLGMADDFAGATLMGLGCCAPDVFSGIFGVLVLKTDVGAGTIVGSLLFNHLAILGGICLAVQPFKIKLSSFIREVTFYAISLALLLWSLWDGQITVLDSSLFLVTYIVFCVVCGYTPRIAAFCNRMIAKMRGKNADSGETEPLISNNGNIQDQNANNTFYKSPESVTAGSSSSSSVPSTISISDSAANLSGIYSDNEVTSVRELSDVSTSSSTSTTPSNNLAEGRERLIQASQLSYHEYNNSISDTDATNTAGTDIGFAYGSVTMHGYIQKKSTWYTKIRMSSRQWQTRWMVLDEQLWYCRNPLFPNDERRTFPLWAAYKVELDQDDPTAFTLYTQPKKFTFRAENAERAREWVDKIGRRIEIQREKCPDLVTDSGIVGADCTDEENRSLWDMPEDKTWKKVMWALATPYYALFSVTIPNVKRKKYENWFIFSFIICLIWIGALSFAMVKSADRFALAVGIEEDIMGLTITAIGASLPSFFGSVIAAREGSYHMAVSNTFGANLSSILVALGLPCFIQTAMVTPGKAFPMESDGIFLTVIVLVIGLVIFLISIGFSRMWLNKPLGVLYFALYAILLTVVVVCDYYGITLVDNRK